MTAVEFLEKILKQNYGAEFTELNKHIFDKAKEMEKQQLNEAFKTGQESTYRLS